MASRYLYTDLLLVRRALRGRRGDDRELASQLGRIPAMVAKKNEQLGSPLTESELEDVIQDASAAVLAKLGEFDGRSRFTTWLFGFCVNEVRKHAVRKYSARTLVELKTEAREDGELARVDAEYGYLYEGLERLGSPASEVVHMRHFDQLEFAEIAERLEIPLSTAKTHYYRALLRLAEWLEPTWKAEQ